MEFSFSVRIENLIDKNSIMTTPSGTSLSCSAYFLIHKKIILISVAAGALLVVSLGLGLGLTTTSATSESMCKIK